MRTTAEAPRPRAAGRRQAPGATSGRTAGNPPQPLPAATGERAAPNPQPPPQQPLPAATGDRAAPNPPQPAPQPPPEAADAAAITVTAVRMVPVEEGLYALRIGTLAGPVGEIDTMSLPAAHLSTPFAEDGDAVEIVTSFPRQGPWIGQEGGTAILRSPEGGGFVILTVYGAAGQQAAAPSLVLQRLDGAAAGAGAAAPAMAPRGARGVAPARASERGGAPAGDRDIPAEILLHIERTGDRLFPGRGWVGALGRRIRIEAFSMRPLERLSPADIEMKGFLPNGGETAWVPGGVLCGTRGRGLPLTGFAIRVVPQRAGEVDVVYQGSFFSGGISEAHWNGDPCRSTTLDDPLEAINVRLVERSDGAATAESA
ncbi:MAG: hypothetical protein ACM3JG_17295 [Thiohalocapsa sp.]